MKDIEQEYLDALEHLEELRKADEPMTEHERGVLMTQLDGINCGIYSVCKTLCCTVDIIERETDGVTSEAVRGSLTGMRALLGKLNQYIGEQNEIIFKFLNDYRKIAAGMSETDTPAPDPSEHEQNSSAVILSSLSESQHRQESGVHCDE